MELGLPQPPRFGQHADPNPRVDLVIAKRRGRLRRWLKMNPRTRILRGTPTPGADTRTMLGAPAVPIGWTALSYVMVPQGWARPKITFSGPFDVM